MRRLFLICLLTMPVLAACGQTALAPSPATTSASDAGGVAPVGSDIPDNQIYLSLVPPVPDRWNATTTRWALEVRSFR